MKNFKIGEELAQNVLSYIAECPTGNIPAKVAIKLADELRSLPEIVEGEQEDGAS